MKPPVAPADSVPHISVHQRSATLHRSTHTRSGNHSTAAGWSLSIICVLTYLFVIHSGKLDVGSIAIALGLVALLLEGRPLRVPRFLAILAAFLGWALITLPFALDPTRAYERWTDYGKLWLVSFLLFNAVHTFSQWRLVTVGWLALFALFPFRGIVFNIVSGIGTQGRYAWNFAFRNPNDYAAIALLVLTLALVIIRIERTRWIRLSAWAGVVGLPVAILFTGSRAGLLGLFFLAAIVLTFSKRRFGIFALGITASLIAIPFLPDNTKDRLLGIRYLASSETIDQADKYGSAAQRRLILTVATAVAVDHPLIGVGIGNYPVANASYAASRPEWEFASGYRDSHNTYLTLAAETGVLGLVLFCLMVAAVVRDLWRLRCREAKPSSMVGGGVAGYAPTVILGGITGFAVMCFTGSYFYYAFPYLFFTLVALYCDDRIRTRR